LLEIDGRIAEAAEVHLANGRTVEAIRTLLLKPDDEDCVRKANASILRGLWTYLSFGITPERAKTNAKLQELLAFAAKLNLESVPACDRDEVCYIYSFVYLPPVTDRAFTIDNYVSGNNVRKPNTTSGTRAEVSLREQQTGSTSVS
jgi:hypothetical protein